MCKFKDNNLGIKKLVEAISKIFFGEGFVESVNDYS